MAEQEQTPGRSFLRLGEKQQTAVAAALTILATVIILCAVLGLAWAGATFPELVHGRDRLTRVHPKKSGAPVRQRVTTSLISCHRRLFFGHDSRTSADLPVSMRLIPARLRCKELGSP